MAVIQPRLLGINLSDAEHQEITINTNQFRIGRNLELELCLKNINISRLHCIFTKGDNGGWSVACKSANGIKVNETRLEKDMECPLSHGDTIMLAEQSIFFWRFSLDPENDENEHPNQEPKAKKMMTKSPNSRSMSQHMSDQARDGLELRKRAAEDRLLSVVPVEIKEIINSTEEMFQVEGIDVGMVIIVGQVISINSSATKTTLVVDDQSGEIEVVQWIDEDSRQKEAWSEGSHVKVVGNVRSQGDAGKKHVMAVKIQGVPTEAEIDAHLLETVFTHLKIQSQINDSDSVGGGGDCRASKGGASEKNN